MSEIISIASGKPLVKMYTSDINLSIRVTEEDTEEDAQEKIKRFASELNDKYRGQAVFGFYAEMPKLHDAKCVLIAKCGDPLLLP